MGSGYLNITFSGHKRLDLRNNLCQGKLSENSCWYVHERCEFMAGRTGAEVEGELEGELGKNFGRFSGGNGEVFHDLETFLIGETCT